MNSRDVVKALRAAGFVKVAQKGSHIQFKHPHWKGRVTVPHPKPDLPIGTIVRSSGN
jgi:predicted RNA binding protein YcfA (HicA-like mRNA interferase family)